MSATLNAMATVISAPYRRGRRSLTRSAAPVTSPSAAASATPVHEAPSSTDSAALRNAYPMARRTRPYVGGIRRMRSILSIVDRGSSTPVRAASTVFCTSSICDSSS